MAGGKKKKDKTPSLKKEIFLQVFNQLSHDLDWLKIHVGEKKWGSRVKKAAKLLSEGVKAKNSKKVKASKTKAIKKIKPVAKPIPSAEQLT